MALPMSRESKKWTSFTLSRIGRRRLEHRREQSCPPSPASTADWYFDRPDRFELIVLIASLAKGLFAAACSTSQIVLSLQACSSTPAKLSPASTRSMLL